MIIPARLGDDTEVVEKEDHIITAVNGLEDFEGLFEMSRRVAGTPLHVGDSTKQIVGLGNLHLILELLAQNQGFLAKGTRLPLCAPSCTNRYGSSLSTARAR